MEDIWPSVKFVKWFFDSARGSTSTLPSFASKMPPLFIFNLFVCLFAGGTE